MGFRPWGFKSLRPHRASDLERLGIDQVGEPARHRARSGGYLRDGPTWTARSQLAEVLTAACGAGLLSERTFTYRLDLLFSGRLVQPPALVEDLTQRVPRRWLAVLYRRWLGLCTRSGSWLLPSGRAVDAARTRLGRRAGRAPRRAPGEMRRRAQRSVCLASPRAAGVPRWQLDRSGSQVDKRGRSRRACPSADRELIMRWRRASVGTHRRSSDRTEGGAAAIEVQGPSARATPRSPMRSGRRRSQQGVYRWG